MSVDLPQGVSLFFSDDSASRWEDVRDASVGVLVAYRDVLAASGPYIGSVVSSPPLQLVKCHAHVLPTIQFLSPADPELKFCGMFRIASRAEIITICPTGTFLRGFSFGVGCASRALGLWHSHPCQSCSRDTSCRHPPYMYL